MKIKWSLLLIMIPLLCTGQVLKNYKKSSDGINITLVSGTLKISSLSDNAVRIRFFKDEESRLPELIFNSSSSKTGLKLIDSPSKIELKGKKIIVTVDKQTGKLSFADNTGKILLSEKADSRKLIPGTVMNEPCYLAEQSFESLADEFIFGLGQFQDGHFNLKNITRKLTQVNSQISIPFIYSSKGYGLLWHQYGLTDFNPADNFISLEKRDRPTSGNQLAEVTTSAGTQKVSQNQSLYTAKFSVPQNGVYSIFLDLGDMDNRQYVVIDGKPCIDVTNFWLPPTISELIELKAGEHNAQLICKSSNSPKLSWKLIDNSTTFRSPNAKQLDYVVFSGSADEVIASYRKLSGNVPMLPRWAFGFWQCRERYTSGTHLVETAKEFRNRNLPMDVIVQDWQYWGNNGWGVPQFDEKNYPNPSGFIKELHDLNTHFNISIWSNPDRNSVLGKMYEAKNLYIDKSKWLDYFSPVTRETYWKTLKENLFDHGVDSWWMDATEPENDALKGEKTFLGAGDFYRLTYPMFVSQAVYEGQRKTSSDKRVCILTRSAFLGQQKYGVINWSGDIGGTWDSYRRQIVAGLNYTITGFPYWTTDIGGFFRPGKTQYTDEKYQELLTRWFQWGALNPIFRVHGYQSETEPWKYGEQTENNVRKMLNLRYRLMPYIYSEAWQVTKNGSTIMRPLVMDFPNDENAIKQQNEFMFGKNFLTVPVTEPNVKELNVYLPKSCGWYDFWTGKKYEGGQTINTDAPLDRIPIFVKAGSIISLGKLMQYSGEKSADTLEIRIYQGADGKYELYEDQNDNYNYEKRIYSTIKFYWNDATKTLKIENRKGEFPGMLKTRIFLVVIVDQNRSNGIEISDKVDKVIEYNGSEKIVRFK
jgi:alpha-D-xyloside xylohydrolase